MLFVIKVGVIICTILLAVRWNDLSLKHSILFIVLKLPLSETKYYLLHLTDTPAHFKQLIYKVMNDVHAFSVVGDLVSKIV